MIPVSWIAAGLVVLAVGGYVAHCEHVKADRAAFISDLKAKAEAQKRRIKEIERDNQKAKDDADADNAKLRADNTALAIRLRNQRSDAGYLPAAAATSKRPDLATFDRGGLERALQQFDEGVSGLLAEGDQARIDLNTAKVWAKGRK